MFLGGSAGNFLLWLVNLFLNLSITFKMKDIGLPFRLNKETIELISVFSNESFNEYR